MKEVEKIFDRLVSDAGIKVILSTLAVLFHWFFGGKTAPVAALFGLVAIDAITGLLKATIKGGISSRGFKRGAFKFVLYILMLKACLLFDSVCPKIKLPFIDTELTAFVWVSAYLAGTELISILENIGEMGIPVPTALIKRLKVLQKDQNDQN